MRDIQILQQTIENQCPEIHKKRLSSLMLATKTVLDGSDLTLTKIGRALDTDTTVKHAIKRIDRLLGNRNLRRVLSISRLGKEVRCHRRYRIQESQYHWAMVEYQRLTHTCGLGEL